MDHINFAYRRVHTDQKVVHKAIVKKLYVKIKNQGCLYAECNDLSLYSSRRSIHGPLLCELVASRAEWVRELVSRKRSENQKLGAL